MRALLRFFLFFWLCAAVPARALAAGAPKATAAEHREAREAFTQGEKAFSDGDYAGALTAFQHAFAAVPHDAVRFNIAVCLERLGRYREALEQYEAAAKSDMLDDKDRDRARRSADTTRAELGTLVAESGSPGTRVTVDDTLTCTVPCRMPLDPGPHRVALGDAPAITLEVERGRDQVLLPPRAAPEKKAPPPPVRKKKPAPPPPPPARHVSRGPSWLTWAGAGLAVAGGASTAYFGLRTQSLHDDYVRDPTQQRYDDGRRSKLITNVSIGVAAVGAVMVAIDLILLAPQEREQRHARRANALLTF
jgi:hypothetical protein